MSKAEYKILIVDDDKMMQEILTDRLSKEPSFKIFTAGNGREGMDRTIAEHPDLILLDVQMPVMDGIAMIKEVRKNPMVRDIKVIFLTNFDTDEKSLLEVSEYRPTFYLIKANTNAEELMKRVKETLGIWN